MAHVILHHIDDDGKHTVHNYDARSVEIRYDTDLDSDWLGNMRIGSRSTSLYFGAAGSKLLVQDQTLDDAIVKLIQSLTERAVKAEQDAITSRVTARGEGIRAGYKQAVEDATDRFKEDYE